MDEEIIIEDQPIVPETTGPIGEDNMLIIKYFPNVAISETNRQELMDAASKLEDHEGMTGKISKQEEYAKELMAILNEYPELGEALLDARAGEDLWSALAKYIDFSAIEPGPDEPDYAKYDSNRKMRMEKLTAKDQREKQLYENEIATDKVMKEFKQKHDISDEVFFGQFWKMLVDVIGAVHNRSLTVPLLESIWYTMNRDKDIESAKNEALIEGEVKGRNTKIKDLKAKKEMMGDDLPDFGAGAISASEGNKKQVDPFIEVLKQKATGKPILG